MQDSKTATCLRIISVKPSAPSTFTNSATFRRLAPILSVVSNHFCFLGNRYQPAGELPMNAEEFRSTLNPVSIANNRATVGGPQPAELERMLKLAEQDAWLKGKRDRINTSLARLDADFGKLLAGGK
jgi:hypothetical protein